VINRETERLSASKKKKKHSFSHKEETLCYWTQIRHIPHWRGSTKAISKKIPFGLLHMVMELCWVWWWSSGRSEWEEQKGEQSQQHLIATPSSLHCVCSLQLQWDRQDSLSIYAQIALTAMFLSSRLLFGVYT